MDHDSIVNDWKQNAESHDEENYAFLSSMKFQDYGFEPDAIAGELHEQVFNIVDCTNCANCCKTMEYSLKEEDIQRISGYLKISVKELLEMFPEFDVEKGVYRVLQKPCPFLGEDDTCTIYEVRPAVCREFPHTDKHGFTFRTMGTANNALTCPAVYWIVEQMKQESLGLKNR